MFTMAPGRLAANHRLPAVCATSQAPRRLVFTTESQSSIGISMAGFTIEMPALLITISTAPKAFSEASKAEAIESGDCTSRSTAAALTPAAVSST